MNFLPHFSIEPLLIKPALKNRSRLPLFSLVITETILDIAGIKNNYEQQLTAYNDIEGFDYTVDRDLENEYTVVYKIDLNKINDTDLQRFNIDRNLTNLRTTYETQGYTCK